MRKIAGLSCAARNSLKIIFSAIGYMEQLENYILTFEASAKRGDGGVVPFSLRVTSPEQEDDGGFYCFVECLLLRETPFKIYGADEEQACELVTSFLRQRLRDTGTKLYNAGGDQIEIPEIEFPAGNEND